MSGILKWPAWLYYSLTSKKLALILFLLLCLVLIPGTFSKDTNFDLGLSGSIVFAGLVLNLFLCTVRRIKTLSKTVIVLHIGILMTFSGTVISSFGYVATVNIYEGTSVDTVYRWDKEKDMPLGVELMVKKINLEYYPIPVKVGVLRGEEKIGLFELTTGESFRLQNFTVKAESLELLSENLRLSVYDGDQFISLVETAGKNNLPADIPYSFMLVAYKDPSLLRMWVDLELFKDSDVVAEGTSEVNRPLTWEKIKFHFTKADVDKFGNRYAGIQIRYDPGLPYVYAGFLIMSLGCLMYLRRRLHAC